MGDVAVTGDLVAGVNHHDPALQIIRQHARNLTQGGGLSDAWAPHQQQGLTTIQQIPNQGHGAEDRTTDPAGQADHIPPAIADGADPMQGPLDSGAIVCTETTQPGHHGVQVVAGEGNLTKGHRLAGVARLRDTSQIQHHLQQLVPALRRAKSVAHWIGEQSQQPLEIVCDPLCGHHGIPRTRF
jgi:hypothetical protein